MARYGKKAAKKVKRAMHERKQGTLRSGRSGRKVLSALVPAEAGHHALGSALVLHFDHRALAGEILAAIQLRNHPVQAGAFEARQPIERDLPLARARCEVQGRPHLAQQLLESRAARRRATSP